MDPLLARRLSYALVGDEVGVGACACEDALLTGLAAAGWDASAIRRHAQERSRAAQPWPHPVPVEWLRDCGAARWAALLAGLVRSLRLDLEATVRADERPLTADERRLLVDLPPHHVG